MNVWLVCVFITQTKLMDFWRSCLVIHYKPKSGFFFSGRHYCWLACSNCQKATSSHTTDLSRLRKKIFLWRESIRRGRSSARPGMKTQSKNEKKTRKRKYNEKHRVEEQVDLVSVMMRCVLQHSAKICGGPATTIFGPLCGRASYR